MGFQDVQLQIMRALRKVAGMHVKEIGGKTGKASTGKETSALH